MSEVECLSVNCNSPNLLQLTCFNTIVKEWFNVNAGVAFLVLFKFSCRNNVIMVKVTGGYSSVIGSTPLIGTNVD